jgi:transposase-like protein
MEKKVEESKAVVSVREPIKPRRKFDPAFKRDAVALWLESGKPAREVGEELGICGKQLYLWRKQYAPNTPAQQVSMESELAALRRENALLRQQRDILKKTLGILSEAPKSATNGLTL